MDILKQLHSKNPKLPKAGRKGCDICHLPRQNMSKKLIETISWDKDIFVIRRIVTNTLTYHLITSVVHVIDIFREENTFNLLLCNVVKWSDTLAAFGARFLKCVWPFYYIVNKGLKLIHKINLYILLSLPRVTIRVTRTCPTIIMLQKIKFYSSFGKNLRKSKIDANFNDRRNTV